MTRVLVTGGTGELGRRVSLPAHKRNLEPLHVQWVRQMYEIPAKDTKAELVGITVLITEAAYTSKASFLDLDPLPAHDPLHTEQPTCSGSRVSWGMYRASGKRLINADVNGSYNIARKVIPTAFGPGIEAPAVRPRRLAF